MFAKMIEKKFRQRNSAGRALRHVTAHAFVHAGRATTCIIYANNPRRRGVASFQRWKITRIGHRQHKKNCQTVPRRAHYVSRYVTRREREREVKRNSCGITKDVYLDRLLGAPISNVVFSKFEKHCHLLRMIQFNIRE